MHRVTHTEMDRIREVSAQELQHIAGGRINLRQDGPAPRPQEPSGHGIGYFLPEMEMDTGPIFLPF